MSLRHRQGPAGRNAGFSLLELAVVMAIVIILSAMVAPTVTRSVSRGQLENAALQMVQDLRQIREQAILYQHDLRFYIQVSPSGMANLYRFELFQKNPTAETHWAVQDDASGDRYVHRTLEYGLVFGAPPATFDDRGWDTATPARRWYSVDFYAGADGHFRGQPSHNGTIVISNPRTGQQVYVKLDTVGRATMSWVD